MSINIASIKALATLIADELNAKYEYHEYQFTHMVKGDFFILTFYYVPDNVMWELYVKGEKEPFCLREKLLRAEQGIRYFVNLVKESTIQMYDNAAIQTQQYLLTDVKDPNNLWAVLEGHILSIYNEEVNDNITPIDVIDLSKYFDDQCELDTLQIDIEVDVTLTMSMTQKPSTDKKVFKIGG